MAKLTGKTHLLLKQYKLDDLVYLASTNKLVKNKSNEFDVPGFTVHNYFNLMKKEFEKNKHTYTNIILDKSYMLSHSYMEIIFKSWKLKKATLFILYDDKQLPLPASQSSKYESEPITEMIGFNDLPKIELTKNYRFTEEMRPIADFYRNNWFCSNWKGWNVW